MTGAARLGRGVAAIVAATALVAAVVDLRWPGWASVGDAVAGLALAVAAAHLLGRGAARWRGFLVAAASLGWSAGTIGPFLGLGGSAGLVVLTIHRGPLVHGLLAGRDGLLLTRRERLAVAAAWLSGAVPTLAGDNRVQVLVAVLVAAAAARTATRGRDSRMAAGALLIAAALMAEGLSPFEPATLADGTGLLYAVAVGSVATALVVATRGEARRALTGLIVDLGDRPDAVTLRRGLADALDDPDLALGIWLPEEGRYVDEHGAPVDVAADSGRTATPLGEGDSRIGVLLHDVAVLDDPQTTAAVAATAAVAMHTARLHARAFAELAELQASRRRLVETVDEERRRLGTELEQGAERHLDACERALRAARLEGADEVEPLLVGLGMARDDLRRLAAGIDPSTLRIGGLGVALRSRSATSPVPVEVVVTIDRLPSRLETALLLVCAEALANAIKHAGCTHLTVRIEPVGGAIVATVVDDGGGGADPSGSGLRGLADRVEALGGHLEVESASGRGTLVRATLPQPFPRTFPQRTGTQVPVGRGVA